LRPTLAETCDISLIALVMMISARCYPNSVDSLEII